MPVNQDSASSQEGHGSTPLLPRAGLSGRFPEAGMAAERRFLVEHLLGIGSSGEVFSVADGELERRVAVKILNAEASRDPQALRNFLHEARLTASIQHPNVLPVYDVDVTEDGRPYFSMGHVHGRTLASALGDPAHPLGSHGAARINLIVTIFIDVCNAVAFAHHREIVHQDIKPENILIGEFGEVLVLDWGCAFRGQMVADGTYGTPLYMSPEQARREVVDARSDIFCIGASLFHALTLRYPTWNDDPETFVAKRCRGEMDPLTPADRDAAPEPLIAIAMKAMAPNAADRYPDLPGMIRDLESYQAGLSVSAHRDSTMVAARRWYRRHVAAFWFGTVALAMLTALVVVVLVEDAKRRSAWRLVYSSSGKDAVEMSKAWVGQTMPWASVKPGPAPLDDTTFFAYGQEGTVIRSTPAAFTDLSFSHPFQGGARVEWDATLLNRRMDLNCFISAGNRLDGYTFHVGGFGDPTSVTLTRASEGAYQRAKLPAPLRIGVRYHFVMEREEHHVSLSIDGASLIDAYDRDTIDAPIGTGFGFDTCSGGEVAISSIRISSRPVPQLVPASAIADRLFRMRLYVDARTQYAEIHDTYRGSTMASDALFRMALCDLRGGNEAAGIAGMERFERDYPSHYLVPQSWYERARVLRLHGDVASAEAIEASIKERRGHPALRRMFFDATERYAVDLAPQPILKVGDAPYPVDIVPRLISHYDALKELSGLSGAPMDNVSVNYGRLLTYLGANDVVLERIENDYACADALNAQGRYDEVLRLYPHLVGARSVALMDSGRAEELCKDPDMDGYALCQTLYELGRIDDAPEHLRHFFEWQLRAGRWEEILASPPDDPQAVDRALLKLGRPAEILAHPATERMTCEALVALGRYEELLDHPSEYYYPWITALHRYADGHKAEARALIKVLIDQRVSDHDDWVFFARWILPSFLDALDGVPGIRERLKEIATEQRLTCGQRPAYYALFLAGAMNDEAFQAQPFKRRMRANLLLVQAMRAEMDGDRAAAHVHYREIVALPPHLHDDEGVPSEFIAWRLRETAP